MFFMVLKVIIFFSKWQMATNNHIIQVLQHYISFHPLFHQQLQSLLPHTLTSISLLPPPVL